MEAMQEGGGMTTKEKDQLRRAIHLIHVQADYYGGMNILAKLAGMDVSTEAERKRKYISSLDIEYGEYAGRIADAKKKI
jgi:hypothetical protein